MKVKPKLVAVAALLTVSAAATGQTTTQDAHNQGMSLGKSELQRNGNKSITESNAQANVPFYKDQPVQKNDSRTDANFFFDTGVAQINSSKGYTSGKCDREGFNPEVEARKGVGEAKWAKMSLEQRTEAIKNQSDFFDQECEGINFLAGEYPGRTVHEIPPGDDLNNWKPNPMPPDVPGACVTNTVTTPATYDKYFCNESTGVEKRQCFDTANITVTYTDGLPDDPVRQVIYNDKSPLWELTVYPSQGLIQVVGPQAITGTHQECKYECIDGGGDAGTTICGDFCKDVHTVERAEEWISMYGGQTTIWQTFKTNERFRVRSRPTNSCIFRVDNWHYAGGAGYGPEDNHMTWTYNFCVPQKQINVTWNNNCGPLEAAVGR